MNPNAIHLIEPRLEREKIFWEWKALSKNPLFKTVLEEYSQCINWCGLSCNPKALHLLEANPDKIIWNGISRNPAIFSDEYLCK